MSESRLLVATVKNEGPNILEWVAHHRAIGFDRIQIYQNDSDDNTERHLRTLEKIGAIEYFPNACRKHKWQNKAYRRASFSENYKKATWCMALDGDEFLHVKTGDGKVSDLIHACEGADQILVNWRYYGNANHSELSDELVTARFNLSEGGEVVGKKRRGYKSLFKTAVFKRPGIHRAKAPFKDDYVVKNGSGKTLSEAEIGGWRMTDPDLSKFAHVNHYAVRDASSFLIKSARGSSSHVDRAVELRYWKQHNINRVEDNSLSQYQERTWAVMEELNEASSGKLFKLRKKALQIWQGKLEFLKKTPEYQMLFDQITSRNF